LLQKLAVLKELATLHAWSLQQSAIPDPSIEPHVLMHAARTETLINPVAWMQPSRATEFLSQRHTNCWLGSHQL
jgi:hypothetical protein